MPSLTVLREEVVSAAMSQYYASLDRRGTPSQQVACVGWAQIRLALACAEMDVATEEQERLVNEALRKIREDRK